MHDDILHIWSTETYFLKLLHEPALLLLYLSHLPIQKDVFLLHLPPLFFQLQHLVGQLTYRPISILQFLHYLSIIVAQIVTLCLSLSLLAQLPKDLRVDKAWSIQRLLRFVVSSGVIDIFILPKHAILKAVATAQRNRARLITRHFITTSNFVDFVGEGSDGLAIFAYSILKSKVLALNLTPTLLCLQDASSKIFIFLPDCPVDLYVVTHVSDM